MSANKKPRKKYKPKPKLVDPLGYVLESVRPMTTDLRTTLQIINHGAMARLVSGEASWQDWTDVTHAINVAAALCVVGVGKAYLPDVQAAMTAHANCGKRMVTTGKLGYTGPDMTAVNLALEIHDAQLEAATVQEIETANKLVSESKRQENFYASPHEGVKTYG